MSLHHSPRGGPPVPATHRQRRCGGFNDERARRRDGDNTGSARSSGGSLPRGPARVCRCVRSSNGAHTVHRWAKQKQPCWPPPPCRVEPPVWPGPRRRSTQLSSRYTGPLASPAVPLPCSSCLHPTDSRRTCRQTLSGAAQMTGPVDCSTASGSVTAALPELLRRVIAPDDGRGSVPRTASAGASVESAA